MAAALCIVTAARREGARKKGQAVNAEDQDKAGQAAHRLGVALVLASTVPFALSGVFTRLITADVWVVLSWRGLIGGLATLA